MKLKITANRSVILTGLLMLCFLCTSCVTTGTQTLGLDSLTDFGKTYSQSQKTWDTFNYVDANKRLPSAYPAKAERQEQYQQIQNAWNAVKNTYK